MTDRDITSLNGITALRYGVQLRTLTMNEWRELSEAVGQFRLTSYPGELFRISSTKSYTDQAVIEVQRADSWLDWDRFPLIDVLSYARF